jgi:isopenicillin N synthase-like dioxygenase
MSKKIPIIDVGPLLGADPEGERTVARAIGEACRGIGFFYIVFRRAILTP